MLNSIISAVFWENDLSLAATGADLQSGTIPREEERNESIYPIFAG